MKTVNTYLVEYKSGRREKVFACSISDLKQMINFENTSKVKKLD